MADIQKLIQDLKYIKRLAKDPNSFSKEEIKDQPNDTPIVKALKNNIRTSEIIKQKDLEINQLKINLTQKENQLEQTIKDFQEKEQTKHQEYLNILQNKEKDWESKLEQALKKPPTAEMGTQTELTAEQINQMEKDIERYRDLLYQGAMEIDKTEKELTTLQSEIKSLQEQLKDKEINEAEKELLYLVEKGISTPLAGTIVPDELLKRLQDEKKWISLRPEYEIVRTKLIFLTKIELERRDLQTKITELEKDKGELQTKYDMEVRSKSELVRFLNIYRKSMSLDIDWKNNFDLFHEFHQQHNNLWFYTLRFSSGLRFGSQAITPPLEIDISNIKNLWKLWFFSQKKDGEITLRVANTNIKGFQPFSYDEAFWIPSAVYTENKNVKLVLVDYYGKELSPIYSKGV
ncbi:MAG: hypothetical protein MRERV_9c030 [Mycoplasmataceae bacterium RV_VA103A]|nr:MAG: hypothetical protein MRERV_9c030 [Mycoplasmataceae bacterium RV_VA103A]